MLSSPIIKVKGKEINSFVYFMIDYELKILTYTSDVVSDHFHAKEGLMVCVLLKLLHLVHDMSVSNEIPMMVMNAVVMVHLAKNNVEVEVEMNLNGSNSKINSIKIN